MSAKLFTGAATALITPFKSDGSIDFDGLEELIEIQIKNGIQAIVVAGTTGEASTLSFEEYSLLIAKSSFYINHRVPLIAGSGSNNTDVAIKRSLEAQKRGADGLLIVTPYYNKTTQDGMVRHYWTIADRVKLPIIMYNVPSRTGIKIEPHTMKKITERSNVVAIKEASGDISGLADIRSFCPDLAVYCGNDDQIVPFLSLGSCGTISVISNILPKEIQNIHKLFSEKQTETAAKEQLRLLPLIRALFSEINPIPIKGIMNDLGLPAGSPRLPLIPSSDDCINRIKNELSALGICLKK
ncbi:MAG: 4-hydroxy-tetrahydrodipicolinate synthase [Clostridia bacterium]|nr:4-hydroxy-tetrahydrodipicolinate synthase [Clostridia bacterium]